MKPLFLKDILNYEYPVQALNANTSNDCSEAGFFAQDLTRDFYKWRSNTKDQIDIYFEISEPDSLNCFAVLGTNLSTKAQIYISASNTSGISGFSTTLYTKTLTKKNQNWILFTKETLPPAQYYKLTIIENDPSTEINYVEVKRIICGIAEEFPVRVKDGFVNGKESFQKRQTQKGQWRPGSEDSMLNTFEVEFEPIFGNRFIKNNDYRKAEEMEEFIKDVKTTKPFLFILNPDKPEQLFDYVVLDQDNIEVSIEDNGTIIYTFAMKELK